MKAQTREEAYRDLLRSLEDELPTVNLDAMLNELLHRSALDPFMVDTGVSIPHLRLPGLSKLMLAVGTSVTGIPYGPKPEDREHVIFLVLTPRSNPEIYLQFLAGLSKRLRKIGDIHLIAGCTTANELCAALAFEKEDFPEYLSVKHVMDRQPSTLLESDSLETAIQVMNEHQLYDMPVVDEQGDVRGVVQLEDVLKLSLPHHLLWMDDLTPIIQFEPFAELLRREQEIKVADFMSEEFIQIKAKAPAIHLAKIFLVDKTRIILVMKGRRLRGVVKLRSFMSKLFWA